MPLVVAPAVRAELEAPETREVFLALLTVTAPSWIQRFVNDNADLESRGETYIAYPFELALPLDDDERMSEATIRIDNVSGAILDALRSLDVEPDVTLEVVRRAAPDDVLLQTVGLKLRAISTSNAVIEGKLIVGTVYALQYPMDDFTPSQFPGLFP